MAEEQIIYSIKYDTEQAEKNLASLTAEQIKLKEEQRDLTKLYQFGALTLDEYGRELSKNKKALSDNAKAQRDEKKTIDTTNGSLNAQRKRLSDLNKEWANQERITKAGKKRFNELGKEIEALNEDIKKQEQGVGDFRRSVGDYTNSIVDAIGQTQVFGVSLGQVAAGTNAVNTAIGGTSSKLKLLKTALVSTGIGALLVAIGTLITYFTRSQEGIDKFKQAFAGVNAAIDVFLDRISRVGGIIIDIFTGNTGIVEGAKQSADAMKGIGDELQREVNLAIELERRSQDLRRSRLIFTQTEAILQAEIEKTRSLVEDATRAEEDRVKSAQSAQQLINALFDARKRNLQEELNILKQQIALSDETTTIEDLEKQSELQTQIFLLEKDRASQLKEVRNQENSLNKVIEKRAEAERRQLEAIEKAGVAAALVRKELAEESEKEEQKREVESIKRLERIANEGVRIARDEAEKKLEIANQAARAEEQIEIAKQDAKLNLAATVADTFASIAGEQTILQKVLASAAATVDTYAAAAAALRLPLPPPIPGLTAASYIVQGLGYVAKINGIGIPVAEEGMLVTPHNHNGDILSGKSHAQGGIILEAEHGEIVLGKRVSESPYLMSLVDEISMAAGYPRLSPKKYMRDGGIALASANRQITEFDNTRNAMREAFESMPPIFTRVKDIRKGLDEVVRVENRSKIG